MKRPHPPAVPSFWLAVGLVLLAAMPALAQPVVREGVLTDKAGLTLYVFDNELTAPGRSLCSGTCLNMWTPLYATAKDKPQGENAIIRREDGKLQWTYKGRPLYRWYDDKKPGDQGGDGLRQVWHVARP